MAVFVGTVLGSLTVAGGATATAAAIMGTGITIGWGSALTIASIAYQAAMARKARKAADARKGQFVAAEGAITTLPIVYGRARVAGNKVFQETKNTYTHAEPNPGSTVFMAGKADGTTYEVEIDDPVTGEDRSDTTKFRYDSALNKWFKIMQAEKGTTLDADRQVENNSLLFVEQALCVGPIHACHEAIIDDYFFYNRQEYRHGLKIVVHNEGGIPDSMIQANFAGRAEARFTDVAHAAMVFNLDRDDPQFSGAPNVNFLIEGRKVFTVIQVGGSYGLSTERTYSINPAYCLLDYLMDARYGQGLTLSELSLESFYNAAQICERAAGSAPVAGHIWKNTSGTRNQSTNIFKIFECNVVLDTANTVRENVNALLGTMQGARLVWAGGVYKLSLVYPKQTDTITPVAVITDSVLSRENFDIQPPSLDERYNFCTVRFFNEAKDFKEDTVTWPSKNTPVYSAYLVKDNNRELETDVAAEGVTSKMLATAFAEELVRSSRRTTKFNFSVILKDAYFEPGDILEINSEALELTPDILGAPLYVQIDEIEVSASGTASIRAVRFDKASLAWNADDNNDGDIDDPTDGQLLPPTNFAFENTTEGIKNNMSGRLTWTPALGATGYRLYFGKAGEYEQQWDAANNVMVNTSKQSFTTMGDSLASPFEIPAIANGRYVFGIRSIGLGNRMSAMAVTESSALVTEETLPAPLMTEIPPEDVLWRQIKVRWTQPPMTRSQNDRYFTTEVWFNNTNAMPLVESDGNVLNATFLGSSSNGTFTDTRDDSNALRYYFARNKSKTNKPGPFSDNSSQATPILRIADYLENINDFLNENSLIQSLRDKINFLDPVPAALALIDSKVTAAKSLLDDKIAAIEDGVTDITITTPSGSSTLKALKVSHENNVAAFVDFKDVYLDDNTATAEALSGITTRLGNAESTVLGHTTLIATNNNTAVSRLDAIDSKILDPVTGLAASHARIGSLETTTATDISAVAGRTATLEATVNNPSTGLDTKVDAAAVNSQIATSTTSGAIATAISGLKATVDTKANVYYSTTEPTGTAASPLKKGDVWYYNTLSGGVNAVYQYIFNGTNWVYSPDVAAVAADARVNNVETAQIGYCKIGNYTTDHTNRSTCQAAGGVWNVGIPLAQAVKQVAVNYNGAVAGVEQAMTAVGDDMGKVKASYQLRVNANGHVAGVGIDVVPGVGGAMVGTFAVVADRFFIAGPDGANSQAFSYFPSPTVINGIYYEAGIYANKARIDNLRITRGQIAAGSIASSFAATGTSSCTVNWSTGPLAVGESALVIVNVHGMRYYDYSIKGESSRVVAHLDSTVPEGVYVFSNAPASGSITVSTGYINGINQASIQGTVGVSVTILFGA